MKDNVYWIGAGVCALVIIYLVVGILMLPGHLGMKECGMDLLFSGITLFLLLVSIGFINLCDRV
jgi:hypothetical protein